MPRGKKKVVRKVLVVRKPVKAVEKSIAAVPEPPEAPKTQPVPVRHTVPTEAENKAFTKGQAQQKFGPVKRKAPANRF